MKSKIIKWCEIIALAIIFYISDRFYTIFLGINWAIEEYQKKKGYKDRGERKYDKETFIIFSLMIPEGTPLTGPQVSKVFYEQLSQEHIYKIIKYRKVLNDNHDGGLQYMRNTYLRKIFPADYS